VLPVVLHIYNVGQLATIDLKLRRGAATYAAVSASNRRMTSGARSIASNNARAGASGVLLPIMQCCDREVERVGKFNLCHSEALPQNLNATLAAFLQVARE
jgi:hypothetical protein